MDFMTFDLLSQLLVMKKDLEEEQRKSALSRFQSQSLNIELDKSNRRIVQLGALSSKICETIKIEREEKRKLQLQYCPETLGAKGEDCDDRENIKLFEDDEKEGGVMLYIQNTEYKQIVLNVKDLTDICEVTTDSDAENELTSLDSEETKKKKKKSKKLSKMQSKHKLPVPPALPQPSKRKKKKKHNDSLSDDDFLVIAPELQRITLTEDDIDTLTEDFDEAHTLKLRRALEDLMRAQGVCCGDTTTREGTHDIGDQSAVTDETNDSVDNGSGWVNVTDSSEVSHKPPLDFKPFSHDGMETSNASLANSNTFSAVRLEKEVEPTKKKKKNMNKKTLDPSFDVNDVD